MDITLFLQHLVNPCQGHLEAVHHIYSYLKKTLMMQFLHSLRTTFLFSIGQVFMGDVSEAIPSTAPETRGNPVQMKAFVDTNHAGNQVTCRLVLFCFVFTTMIFYYCRNCGSASPECE
jgi:hypothetical protein